MASLPPPKALLFDIGGVVVVSPFQAILDYEIAHSIPVGWINHAISRTSPHGSWHRLERGEITLDDDFFASFKRDLEHPELWRAYCRQKSDLKLDPNAPPPSIDAKTLFWNMMRISRTADPYMYPALQRLKREGKFVLGALSNTVVFPKGIKDENGEVFESEGLRWPAGVGQGEGAAEADGVVAPSPLPTGNGEGHERTSPSPTTAPANLSPLWKSTPLSPTTLPSSFHVFLSSAHIGLRKPDPRIYHLAIRELDAVAKKQGIADGIGAKDVLFLDDIGQNLKAAKEAGMRTLRVELGKTRDAVRELGRITGVPLLGEEEKAKL